MSTLAQLRTQLQARGYGTDTATVQTELLNSAYRELIGDHHWSFLEALTTQTLTGFPVGAVTFTATDVLHAQALRMTVGASEPFTEQYNLRYLEPNEYRSYVAEHGEGLAGNLGIPEFWTWRGGPASLGINFYPHADKLYSFHLDYIKDPPDLSADGDIPILPATYHDLLVYGALAEMAGRHRDWAQADRYRARFDRGLSRMRAQLGLAQQQTSIQVTKSGFFEDPARWPEW